MLRAGLVIDAVSLAGSEHVDQDVWGYRDETVWVVDGATARSTPDGDLHFNTFSTVQLRKPDSLQR